MNRCSAPEFLPQMEILLATWNGEAYLPALLDSLLAQTCRDWSILARDDGSTDRTREILASFCRTHPGRLFDTTDGRHLGPAASFSSLMEKSSAPYLFFCDQDDVWLPEKMERSRQQMQLLEEEWGSGLPLLVHGDLRVVDAGLKEISPSLWRYQNLDPKSCRKFNRQLVMNAVTGCTVMINRALADLACPVPAEAVMHDWWLALCASAFGRITSIEEAQILYRQHGANATGGKHFSLFYVAGKLLRFWQKRELNDSIRESHLQAAAFFRRYEERLNQEERKILQAVTTLSSSGFLLRRWHICRHGLWKTGWLRNIGLLLRI